MRLLLPGILAVAAGQEVPRLPETAPGSVSVLGAGGHGVRGAPPALQAGSKSQTSGRWSDSVTAGISKRRSTRPAL
jgi:hypothetical protein